VVLFAASCDTPKTNREFAGSLSLDYPILSDPEKQVARAYGVITDQRAVPHRWTFYIDGDGKILFIDKDVQARTAGADMAARLKALGVPRSGE
jgi:peroxiredoxin Q/BCP